MKLAEALNLRKANRDRITELQRRIGNYAMVQEGDTPAEDPDKLLVDLHVAFEEFEALGKRIGFTNAKIVVGGANRTIQEAILARDVMKMKSSTYRMIASHAIGRGGFGGGGPRFSKSEIKFVPAVDVQKLQELSDQFAQQARELDAKIQTTNWSTDLLEG